MTTKSATYNFKRVGAALGVFGTAAIAYVNLLVVKVDGLQYDIIYSGTPSSKQVLYKSNEGVLQFGARFSFGAKVFVMYQ